MNDEELCKMFGTSMEEVEDIVSKVEAGDYSDFDFSCTTMGRSMVKEKMTIISAPVPASRIAAMRRTTDALGITHAEFVRRAIDHELLSIA